VTELDDLLGSFDESNEPTHDFEQMGEWIESVEKAIALSEFAEVGAVTHKGSRYSFRINGGESEAPHVHIRMGNSEARVFLGSTGDTLHPEWGDGFRNSGVRRVILRWVETHRRCLLREWEYHNNVLHQPGDAYEVTCEAHPAKMKEVLPQIFDLKQEWHQPG